ncbi:hypothetical protein ABH922_005761 [Rhodococcus sp. 27YEA15]
MVADLRCAVSAPLQSVGIGAWAAKSVPVLVGLDDVSGIGWVIGVSKVNVEVAAWMGGGFADRDPVGALSLSFGAAVSDDHGVRSIHRCEPGTMSEIASGIGLVANAAVSAFESENPIRPSSGSTRGLPPMSRRRRECR